MELKSSRLAALLLILSSSASAATPASPIEVWIDVDTATGTGDVDDGLMLIQAFHSPEIKIRGISVVFGNAPLDKAVPIARSITAQFGPAGIVPKSGAAAATDFGKSNEAVEALVAELIRGPMTIAAVGPVTNIGTLVKLHPELHNQIERIVMVAGRRPDQHFVTNERQKTPHRDFNFELDPVAMQAILDTKIPLIFAPWEVSSHVWLSHDDLESLRNTGGTGKWIAETSQYWIDRWEKGIDPRGFNPFDTLAMGWLTHPDLIESVQMKVAVEEALDDRLSPESPEPKKKPYLLVRQSEDQGREVTYCFRPKPEFKAVLMERLSSQR